MDQEEQIELTRRGEPVAILLSIDAYRRLAEPKVKFWDAYTAFRKAHAEPEIQPEDFEGLRDRSPGREVDL